MKSIMDFPCRSCGAKEGEPCVNGRDPRAPYINAQGEPIFFHKIRRDDSYDKEKFYLAEGTVRVRVEASNAEEARDIALAMILDFKKTLPTGFTVSFGEHHQTRKLSIKEI